MTSLPTGLSLTIVARRTEASLGADDAIMTVESAALPASVQMCFSDRRTAIAARSEADPSFRELCRDFDEVVTSLARL